MKCGKFAGFYCLKMNQIKMYHKLEFYIFPKPFISKQVQTQGEGNRLQNVLYRCRCQKDRCRVDQTRLK